MCIYIYKYMDISLAAEATGLFHGISAVQVGFQGTNGGRC